MPNAGTYSEWLYEVEVPGRRSFYWYESQLDLASASAREDQLGDTHSAKGIMRQL